MIDIRPISQITKFILSALLIFNSGCSEDDDMNEEFETPVARFEVGESNEGLVQFTNMSTGAFRFEWNFGDGGTSREQEPAHQYSSNGNYQVTLTAFGADDEDDLTKSVTISDIPEERETGNWRWTNMGDFPGETRADGIQFKYNDRIFVGWGIQSFRVQSDLWEYNISTNEWTEKSRLPQAVRGGIAFVIEGNAYVGLGEYNVFPNVNFWKYDIALDTWSELADFPGQGGDRTLVGATAFEHDGIGYVVNGVADEFLNSREFWKYDPQNNTWTRLNDFPGQGRQYSASFTIGNKVYLGGGLNVRDLVSGTLYNDFWVYNFDTMDWTQLGNLPGTARQGGVGFAIGEKGYFGLGWNSEFPAYISGISSFSDMWEYDPGTDSWIPLPNFPDGSRTYAFVTEFEDRVWIGNGFNNSGREQKDIWEFKFE